MRWFKKHEFPVVPDDQDERLAAIKQSRQGLNESINRVEAVVRVTGSLQLRNEINGYAHGIREAYGMNTS